MKSILLFHYIIRKKYVLFSSSERSEYKASGDGHFLRIQPQPEDRGRGILRHDESEHAELPAFREPAEAWAVAAHAESRRDAVKGEAGRDTEARRFCQDGCEGQ